MAAYDHIFKIKHNNLLPDKGSVLIAEPFLQDALFQRSVILLIEHNINGSMGFVLNKRTNRIINEFFPGFEKLSTIPIYFGGPVCSNKLFFIHTLGDLIPDSVTIAKGIYFDGDFEVLKQHITDGYPVKGKVKFFLGYSGWRRGQLGYEIKEDSWMVSHAMHGNIMLAEGESFWKHSLEVLGSKYKAWVNFPKDPHMN
jgi:putative transcriptional regulator